MPLIRSGYSISRVPDQYGVSLLYIMLEIHLNIVLGIEHNNHMPYYAMWMKKAKLKKKKKQIGNSAQKDLYKVHQKFACAIECFQNLESHFMNGE